MIGQYLENAIELLVQQSTQSLVLMFWYVLLLEMPRYNLSMMALLLHGVKQRRTISDHDQRAFLDSIRGKVSIVVAGLNEAASIEKCVASLREQSFKDFEIVIVSDGSTDGMSDVSTDLVRRGLVDKSFKSDLRCGKSSGVNLACRFASGEFIINVDCDCSYDRFAIEKVLLRFSDPEVGAVCGDILPRNGGVSLIATYQAIEYLMSISLGKRVGDMLDQICCASGAFSAFRSIAFKGQGCLDAGGGEDLDATMRLRENGWSVRFAADAICYTDVPYRLGALVRQRMRWERDAIRVRFRKHSQTINPFSRQFKLSESIHQVDFLIFNVLLSVLFPVYLLYLFIEVGMNAWYLLIAAQLGLMVLDAAILLVAIAATRRWSALNYVIFIPAFSIISTLVMRWVRTWAYIQEWVFDASRRDAHYVPLRVQRERMW